MKNSFSSAGRYIILPTRRFVMKKRPLSTASVQSSSSSSSLSTTEDTSFYKRPRHRHPHTPMHQSTTTLLSASSAQRPSSNKRQSLKPHRGTNHTHKMASVAQTEVEQIALQATSLQSSQPRTGTCLSLVDGPAHSSTAAVPGRLAVSSLEPIATFFRFSHRFGVLSLPFTAFQLRAISVMFAARMEARLRHSGVLSCEPIQLDVDDGVRGSSGSGVEDCVKLGSSTWSGGQGCAVKEVDGSEECDDHHVKVGREESELSPPTMEKQTVSTIGSGPHEMGHQRKGRKERRGARPKKQHPDAFVAIRISSPQIRSSLERIQSSMTAVESRLGAAMVSLDKLHLTLMVLRLGEEEERIARAKAALSQSCARIAAHFDGHSAPFTVPFKGVGSFSSSVVFACVDPSVTEVLQHLRKVADIVRSTFLEVGLEPTDSRPFSPHLTIAKLSKLPPRKSSKRLRLSKDLYSGFTEEFHGSNAVSELELLSMSRPTTEVGYYHCFARSSWVSGESGPPPVVGKEE